MLNTIFNHNKAIIGVYDEESEVNGLINIVSYHNSIISIATFCKLSSIFNYDSAIDAYAVDRIEDEYRFTISYNIQSSTNNIRCQLVTKTKDGLAIISMQDLYPAFNWAEREIWDLSGIFFIKHPDLRRILTDYGFSGHPLRKDFPISGFREVRYVDSIKQIAYDKVELPQSYRLSGISSIWNLDNA